MTEWSPCVQAQHDIFTWFTESQLGSLTRNGIVPEWFHGIISRKTAEELLMSKPPGYFLIRVSESRIGYTLSLRAEDRCRHFMIDALEDGHYIIVGETRRHRCLQDMVDFHRRNPIMPFSEVLTVACGQSSNNNTDYAELLFPQRHPNSNASLLPNNSLHANTILPESGEKISPALPNRPNNMKTPAISNTDRLYPQLEEEFPHISFPLQATPVPMNRNHQPPELPHRSSLPLKQNPACTRTVSAPDRRSTHTVTDHPSSTQRNQQTKPSVVTNLKNFKKKFQKKRSLSQELMNTEMNKEETERRGNTESEYQEIPGEQSFNSPTFSHTCPDMTLTGGELPQEYRQPPPFAPGF
uniref:Hematopoietic SH2 domain containing n=1 Tax=Labrus bergylta TaxID=56723 RepID=A0A3Q3EL67_9LABR|nr:hematopoietic SH2 domain-containing protein homolog isoform X1 [Labrus bergylta]